MNPTDLRIPGPTPVPEEVMAALSHPMINHRGPEFARLLAECTVGLKRVFQTENDIIFYPSSGSGVLEAAIVNTLSPGDRVLAISIGSFGKRFGEIAARYGANVTPLAFEWGTGAEPAVVEETLRQQGPFKAVLVTHNETSTGVTNDVRAVAEIVKPTGALLLVDAVSSLGAIDLRTDDWGIDCVSTGSQKALMCPPGLGLISVSPAAWEAHRSAAMPRFYWDWTNAMAFQNRGENPYTPPVGLYFALSTSLRLIEREGLANAIQRHTELGEFTRRGVQELGLELFCEPRWASSVVTAVKVPEGVDGKRLVALMEEQHGVTIAGGQEHLAGKIFRLGHMGYVSRADMQRCLDALRSTLAELGWKAPAAVH
ncbi:MAG TPA: alanine--glyoxylate aminotransferase family protein [Chloroflexota bacterium]|nr:alanine--glyoxylate aminotransferase family protein [Chloroflexota bacterium]